MGKSSGGAFVYNESWASYSAQEYYRAREYEYIMNGGTYNYTYQSGNDGTFLYADAGQSYFQIAVGKIGDFFSNFNPISTADASDIYITPDGKQADNYFRYNPKGYGDSAFYWGLR